MPDSTPPSAASAQRSRDRDKGDPTHPLQSAVDEIDAIASGGAFAKYVPTGFDELDAVTNGLAPGSLTVIGAHPGVGSSTLALDFFRNASILRNIPAAYVSLNDRVEGIIQRLLSAEAAIRLTDMRSGRMTEDDWVRLARHLAEIDVERAPIMRHDDPDIVALSNTISAFGAEQDVRLVIVDSLHMLTARRDVPYENREREVAEVTRRLKRLALDTNIAIVATAQLSFNPGPRQPVMLRPSLADLRDSGTIAHVADNVLLIYRPDAWERDDPRAGEADLIVAKHRSGPVGTVVVAHQLHYCRFASLA